MVKNINEIVIKTENPAFVDNEMKLDFVDTIDAFEERFMGIGKKYSNRLETVRRSEKDLCLI